MRYLLLVAGLAAWAVILLWWMKPWKDDDIAHVPESVYSKDFFARHWEHPLMPQGMPPKNFSELEASLDSSSCGKCHGGQYKDWLESRHSQTMNAGIRWQFYVFSQAESNKCMNCHAPLAEQKALVAMELEWDSAPTSPPPDYVPENLHQQGLTCAACHVRDHQRIGPVHRAGLSGDEPGLPHAGFAVQEGFSDGRFCASCHQFPEDGPRLNGKLRQDTYNEWLASDFAAQGVSCQQCHMPDRRHLWHGISDPQMVRDAMGVRLKGSPGNGVELEIRNVGAGHHFPAYMVPRIDVRLMLLNPQGELHDELLHHVIQWRASVDLSEEYFDNRLAAGEAVTLEAPLSFPEKSGWSLALYIDVAPKDHYERMYQDMLRQADKMTPATLALLQQAIQEAKASRFRAIESQIPLTPDLDISILPVGNGGGGG